MLSSFTVGFIGHRYIDDSVSVGEKIEREVIKLIRKKESVDFIVGRNGDFDLCVASSIVKIQKNVHGDNNTLILLLPYLTAEYLKNSEEFDNYYGDVEISAKASSSHPKAAIRIRNYELVDRSDLIICYIEHKSGNAWQTVKYAYKKNKTVINLADDKF